MQSAVKIDFQGMKPREALRAVIAEHVADLEGRFGRITACRVVVKANALRKSNLVTMPSIFASSTTGKELKSCFLNNASRSRSVSSRVTVVTSRVMYWPVVHWRNRYIGPPGSLSAYW